MDTLCTTRRRAAVLLAPAVLALALVAGCRTLNVDVEVDPAGGGERRLEMIVGESDDGPGAPTEAQARELLGVTAARGWREGVTEERGADGLVRQRPTYSRVRRVTSRDGWAAASGDIRMQAAPDGAPHGDAVLANRVELETGRGAGGRTWTYRETFAWPGGLEALVGLAADVYRDEVARAYPGLDAAALLEIHALARGAFTVGLCADAAAAGGPEMDEEVVAEALSIQVGAVLARVRPGADRAGLGTIAAGILGDESHALDRILDRDLPGLNLATTTGIKLTLRLPGRIVETNGTLAADGRVSWEFGAGDPLARPVVCWARSELAD